MITGLQGRSLHSKGNGDSCLARKASPPALAMTDLLGIGATIVIIPLGMYTWAHASYLLNGCCEGGDETYACFLGQLTILAALAGAILYSIRSEDQSVAKQAANPDPTPMADGDEDESQPASLLFTGLQERSSQPTAKGAQLFENRLSPSTAQTVPRHLFFGAGSLMVMVWAVRYWVFSPSPASDEFDLCCGSSPTSEDLAMFWTCLSAIGALVGALTYATRRFLSHIRKDRVKQERVPMKNDAFSVRQPLSLSNVRIAAPCQAEWRWMCGNDRVRFCGQCSKNVYNLSAMTRQEAGDFIRNTEGQLCVRFYQRADGTILTQDCPAGRRALKQRFSKVRAALATAILSFGANAGLLEWVSKPAAPANVAPLCANDEMAPPRMDGTESVGKIAILPPIRTTDTRKKSAPSRKRPSK